MCKWYRYSMVPVLRYGTVHCRLYSTFRYSTLCSTVLLSTGTVLLQYGTVLVVAVVRYRTVQSYRY